jgi:subtilisin family serine protease
MKKKNKSKKAPKAVRIKNYLPDFEILTTPFEQTVGYQISKHNIPDIWLQSEGEGVTIAVLDTGCWDHVDLKGAISGGHNFHDNSAIWKDGGCGHGSHCCGIAVARNNDLGIVGVAPKAKLLVVKVLHDEGWGYNDVVNKGIYYAIDQGADIISMSLGSPEYDGEEHSAIKAAYRANIPVICAAGNSGNVGALDYPGRYPETISVGALNSDNIRAEFSQTGPRLDFMAPGTAIKSTWLRDSYVVMSGTSMATPWVAGVVALMMAKHRKLGGQTPVETVEDVREHLRKTCIDLQSAGRDDMTGYGLVDVTAAMDAIAQEDADPATVLPVIDEQIANIRKNLTGAKQSIADAENNLSALQQQFLEVQNRINALKND